MSRFISLRLAIAAVLAATILSLAPLGQSQDSAQSVADAARRAREQKKAAAKQPAPVITNDTLKPSAPAAQAANAPAPAQSPEASSAPAPASAAQPVANSSSVPDASIAPAEQPAPSSPASDADQKAKDSPELAALKQQLAEAQKSLDLQQREVALQQDTYISNPDHSHDIAGKAKLDAMLAQITDKQQDVDALKTQLAALLASLGSTTPAAPSAPPKP
jgi:uncharacterized coiled-coil protein SlyX